MASKNDFLALFRWAANAVGIDRRLKALEDSPPGPPGSAAWGTITGSLSSQSDLNSALNGKQPLATVLTNTTASFTTAQETKLAGIAPGATANTGTVTSVAASVPTGLTIGGSPVTTDGTLAIGLDSGYVIPTQATIDGKEPTIAAGTTAQYWRGDKTWQTLPAGGSPIIGADAPITPVAVNVNSAGAVVLGTKTISVSTGDQVEIELIGSFLNNSGGTVTPNVRWTLGSFSTTIADGTTSATNASNRSVWRIRGNWSVQATNNVIFAGEFRHGTAAAATAAQNTALATNRSVWNTSTANLTGSVVCEIRMFSTSLTATQTFTVHSWKVTKTGTV